MNEPESLGAFLEEVWVLICLILKSLMLLIAITLAFATGRIAFWCTLFLSFIKRWQPVRPAIFAVPRRIP